MVEVNPFNSDIVFAGTSNGMYISLDAGLIGVALRNLLV